MKNKGLAFLVLNFLILLFVAVSFLAAHRRRSQHRPLATLALVLRLHTAAQRHSAPVLLSCLHAAVCVEWVVLWENI